MHETNGFDCALAPCLRFHLYGGIEDGRPLQVSNVRWN